MDGRRWPTGSHEWGDGDVITDQPAAATVAPTARVFEIKERIFVSSATPFAAAQLTQPPCPSSSSSSSPPPCSQPASSSASSPSPSSPQPQVSLLRSPPVRRSPTGKGRTLKAISVMGMGLLVGAALTIIIPEYAQYTALHSVADAGICHM